MPDTSSPPPALPTVEEIARTVAWLVGELDRLTRREAAEAVRPWLTITDPAVARELFESLLDWVRDVWLEFPDGTLPDCWYRHPWAIEELHACRLAWLGAQRKGAAPALLADWLRVTRPGVVARLDKFGTCDNSQHLQTPKRPTLSAPADVDLLVDMWITERSAL